jgi:hypothetical protein
MIIWAKGLALTLLEKLNQCISTFYIPENMWEVTDYGDFIDSKLITCNYASQQLVTFLLP